MAAGFAQEVCTAKAEDFLILNMLVLHCSKPSQSDSPRRVLRLDYSAEGLPETLRWA